MWSSAGVPIHLEGTTGRWSTRSTSCRSASTAPSPPICAVAITETGPIRAPVGHCTWTPVMGYLLTFVHDRASDRSHLLVLDAVDLGRLAAVHLPVRVPGGFRGRWLPCA
jgi:carotenoid cleavage dioxygenase-like enzyme